MQEITIFNNSPIVQFVRENTVMGLCEAARQAIVEDDKDPLIVAQAYKLFADAYKILNESDWFKDAVMSEASKHITEKHGERNPAMFNGFKMYYSANVTVDYNGDAILKDLKLQVKERENLLKNLEEIIIDDETGEVIAEPANFKRKTTLVCTKK